MIRRPRFPFPLNAAIIATGALLVGKSAANEVVAVNPSTVVQNHTETSWRTEVVTRHVRGHVRTLPSGTRVVLVHSFLVSTDSTTITVPQQTLPVTRLHGSLSARPLVPVTVTVYVPTVSTVTVTETVTSTETDIVPTTVTTTISVPLVDGGGSTG